MKKQFFALALAAVLLICAVPAGALTGEGTRAAQTLSALHVVRGAYNVDDPATRAQAAVILVRLAGAEKAAAADKTSIPFKDVPAYAVQSVRYAYGQGWLRGVTGDTFGASEAITSAAYCTALGRLLGYSGEDFSYENALVFARHMAITSRDYGKTLTRGDLFELTAGALYASNKDGGTLLAHLIAASPAAATAADRLNLKSPELTARQAADRYTAAVFQLSMYEDGKNLDLKEPDGSASGFFISGDGLAVTNYHAIADCAAGVATLVSGEQYPVEGVVYYDEGNDIAVLRIGRTSLSGAKTPGFVSLETASRGTLRAGDEIYTIGSPLGLGLAVSAGIVSDASRATDGYDAPCIMSTADISQGSSGGALLNIFGQVVGVTSGAFLFGNNMYLAVAIDPALSADLTGKGQTLEQVKQFESARTETAA
ncbi:S1C family serine protease [Oscillibacter sp.]|uniref:S1C family serine protease n=1 Tax=Oscillibacter sp. TaxID=1945593 RepID=UPI0028A9F51A|nr:S1C family serine protease [Oscillibacter sp.]